MESTSYKIDPSSNCSYAGSTIAGLTDFSFSEDATETTLGTDGKPYLTGSFVGDISYVITVNGVDAAANITTGSAGSLVLKAIPQVNGSGAVSPTKTFTFSNAVCTGRSVGVNHIGNSTITLTFRSVSSTGSIDPLAIS